MVEYHTLGKFLGDGEPVGLGQYVVEQPEELKAAYQRITQLENTLGECREYFESRSDVVDGDYGVPAPNAEMKMLSEIEEVLL